LHNSNILITFVTQLKKEKIMTQMVLDTRIFIVINTTEYPGKHGTALVQSANGLRECENLGWDVRERYTCVGTHTPTLIGEMNIGDMLLSNDYQGAYIMRVG